MAVCGCASEAKLKVRSAGGVCVCARAREGSCLTLFPLFLPVLRVATNQAVENMRNGMNATAACTSALGRVGAFYPTFQGALVRVLTLTTGTGRACNRCPSPCADNPAADNCLLTCCACDE